MSHLIQPRAVASPQAIGEGEGHGKIFPEKGFQTLVCISRFLRKDKQKKTGTCSLPLHGFAHATEKLHLRQNAS